MKRDKWTEQDIPDLNGKVIVVTGGNSGLGFEATKMFVKKNAQVVIASRNLERCRLAKEKIVSEIPNAKLSVIKLDLGSLKSIKEFVNEFKEKFDRLDVLMNNAGVMLSPYTKTEDGFELQNGVNHLGHFALTAQLYPLLKKTKDSRIVNTSSGAHKMGTIDFENYLFEDGLDYSSSSSYGRSKLSNLLFTYELDRRLKKAGSEVLVLAAHPGFSRTNLFRFLSKKWWFYILYPLLILLTQSAYKGALPQVRASVDPKVLSAQYYGPGGMKELSGYPILVKSNEASHNKEDAKKLWNISEKLCGLEFDL